MRPLSPLAPLLWALSLLTLTPARADTPARLPQLNIVALGLGQILEAAPPRQLSLNAHVSDFAYQPRGLEIAYAGSETDSDMTTQFVRLAGTRRGTLAALMTQSGPTHGSDSVAQPFDLVGWSSDGRYLVAEQAGAIGTDSAGAPLYSTRLTSIDVGASPMQTHPIAFPVSLPPDVTDTSTQALWSPSHTRLLLVQTRLSHSNPAGAYTAALYDFAHDHVDVLPVNAPLRAVGWADDTHLRLADALNPKAHPLVFNVATRKTEMPAPSSPRYIPDFSLSPTNLNLALDMQTQTFSDAGHVAQTQARVLWVRRVRGPKALSALALDVLSGDTDPQGRWAQTGQQVAYLSHGDLFVADLSTRDATLKERYFAGDKLTCHEEQQLAMSEIKQIGLATIQYAQDYDESFPPQANVNDTLAPYLPPDALLQIGGAKFAYHAPADLSLAKMDNPADTILGTMDLPCARVTLYADGHVKALPPPAP